MAKRIAITKLNATTLDILNVIRENASAAYRDQVPAITNIKDLPRVGDVLYGYPALANEFVSALLNRIALVKVKSATFNNMFADLKKGYLEFGEVVEEVFVNLAKAREFSVAKAEQREFKRVLPDVRSAFHAMNYKAQYPMTIQNNDIRMAFTRESGVLDLIAKIVDSMYVAAEYDEFLLFKYLIIKGVTKGQMYPVGFDGSNIHNAAKVFRGTSNKLKFIDTKYNASHVHTNTAKEDQQIFMSADFNAEYDVDVLASAFNMDKATFQGKLRLIDDFTTFDSERFSEIIENSDMMEPITDEELALMANVKAVLADQEWFQVYDNLTQFTEAQVASGIYWNYFLNIWKTVSSSPFSNAIAFVDTQDGGGSIALPTQYTATVTTKDVSDIATILTVEITEPTNLSGGNVNFVQTDEATEEGVAVHKYGAYIFYAGNENSVPVEVNVDGVIYETENKISASTSLGATFTLVPKDTVVGVTLPATATVTAGQTVDLKPVLVPTGGTLVCASSATTYATVTNAGVVTGASAGSATITATYTVDGNEYTDTCVVTVEAAE
ncbi:MAG: Ig-like domain-containing protein [Methanobrevibacter sp.]|nr:Ig-like domain-containing protein [Methanobrevibacter sp.]